jgi:hypothetical protein
MQDLGVEPITTFLEDFSRPRYIKETERSVAKYCYCVSLPQVAEKNIHRSGTLLGYIMKQQAIKAMQ